MCLDNIAVFVASDMAFRGDMADGFYKLSAVCWANATVIQSNRGRSVLTQDSSVQLAKVLADSYSLMVLQFLFER